MEALAHSNLPVQGNIWRSVSALSMMIFRITALPHVWYFYKLYLVESDYDAFVYLIIYLLSLTQILSQIFNETPSDPAAGDDNLHRFLFCFVPFWIGY